MPSEWFNRTVYVASVVARTASGDPIYEDPAPVPARVEERQETEGTEGRDRQIETHVFVQTRPLLRFDRLWLPEADPSDPAAAFVVESADIQRDKAGNMVISRAIL
jgi:hypothetical protein